LTVFEIEVEEITSEQWRTRSTAAPIDRGIPELNGKSAQNGGRDEWRGLRGRHPVIEPFKFAPNSAPQNFVRSLFSFEKR
jgi:hypothetical protein